MEPQSMTGLVVQINQMNLAFLYIAKGDIIKNKIPLPLCGTLFFEEDECHFFRKQARKKLRKKRCKRLQFLEFILLFLKNSKLTSFKQLSFLNTKISINFNPKIINCTIYGIAKAMVV
jgi:hypothetical protein